MSCTLGRIGLATASGGDGLTLQSPDRIHRDGDSLKLGGDFAVTDAVGRALADQLSGYGPHNPDEPVIPVTYSATQAGGALDGFYAVLGVEVDYVKLASGLFSWDADLLAIPSYQAPTFEILSKGALRVNGASITTASTLAWIGTPVLISPQGIAPAGLFSTTKSRVTAEGTVAIVYDSSETAFDSEITFNHSASSFYKAACRIEYSADSGVTWRTVTGRQVPNSANYVRISNGLVRVTCNDTSNVVISVEHYDGTQWETAKGYNPLTAGGSVNFLNLSDVSINRNGPEAVSVRWGMVDISALGTTGSVYMDLTLRRASRNVEGYLNQSGSANLTLARTTVEAATALTGGIRATSNDAGGNRYVLALAPATTNDLVNGKVTATAGVSSMAFLISSEIGGSGATTGDTAQNLIYQWMAAMQHRQRIVAR